MPPLSTVSRTPLGALAESTRGAVAGRMMPFLLLLYFFAYVDRTNVGVAKLGMQRELGFSDEVIGFGAGIFFVGYLFLEIPSTLLVERWSARLWIGRIMITWGIVATLMGFVQTAPQFYVLRFALGAAEAGFFPGIIVFLSRWFVASERPRAKSLFLIAQPISQVLGLPLSRVILEHVSWGGIPGWRWVYILEGLPSIVLGIVTIFYLTDWPREAAWLRPDQRSWLTAEIDRERADKERAGLASWRAAVVEPRVYLLSAVSFFAIAGNQSILFFLPSIVERWEGVSISVRVLLTTLPFVASLVGILVAGSLVVRMPRMRRAFVALPLFGNACGLALASWGDLDSAGAMVWLCLAGFFAQAYLPAFWAIPSTILTKSGAAVAVGIITTLGGLGGLCGPWLFGYLRTATLSYRISLLAAAMCLACAGLIASRMDRFRPPSD